MDEDLRSSFDEFDGDGNGKIDLAEFRKLLKALGDARAPAAVEALFDDIDEDETGMVDYAEFEAWWSSR